MKYFSDFSQKTGFDISCKLPPLEAICMKSLILFSGKSKKNVISLSSAELVQRVVKVKVNFHKSKISISAVHFHCLFLISFFFFFFGGGGGVGEGLGGGVVPCEGCVFDCDLSLVTL